MLFGELIYKIFQSMLPLFFSDKKPDKDENKFFKILITIVGVIFLVVIVFLFEFEIFNLVIKKP